MTLLQTRGASSCKGTKSRRGVPDECTFGLTKGSLSGKRKEVHGVTTYTDPIPCNLHRFVPLLNWEVGLPKGPLFVLKSVLFFLIFSVNIKLPKVYYFI